LKRNTKTTYRLTTTGRKHKTVEVMTTVRKRRKKMVLPRTKSHQFYQSSRLRNSWLLGT
jgi:hypothetical protein